MKLAARARTASVRDLPTTEQLLVAGGDARIALDPASGLNKYGCQPFPDPSLLAFGSSTASVISPAGFAAANQLRARLLQQACGYPLEVIYARDMQRVRLELLHLCEVSDPGVELVFAASGTDAHLIVAQYVASEADRQVKAVMVEEDETGSGVVSALTGQRGAHAFDVSSFEPGEKAENPDAIEVVSVPLRLADGAPRTPADIDADVTALVDDAVTPGRRVLLIMVDQSKTGLIAPSPACVAKLLHRHAGHLDVLVDACQFRIAPMTLNAYLQQGFMVALTGSKFLTGPSFSAALLFPAKIVQRLKRQAFPHALRGRSNWGNWPAGWDTGQRTAGDFSVDNFGLLLRWEAALVELRRFRAVPQAKIIHSLQAFAQAVGHRLLNDPHFEPLAVPQLDRRPLLAAANWDQLPTIFPFLLYGTDAAGDRVPFSREETLQTYRRLQADLSQLADSAGGAASLRCQFGQPVSCGTRDGIAVSALRLCISARLISDAMAGKGIPRLIDDALAALDKTAWLVDRLDPKKRLPAD